MFSTKYNCSNCGIEVAIKKFLFISAEVICPKCGSRKLNKVVESNNSGCSCNSNKKSRFT